MGLVVAHVAERPEKAIRVSRIMERNAESDKASQYMHRMQIGYPNARTFEPALHFSEVVSNGEIAGPCELDAVHWETPASTGSRIMAPPYAQGEVRLTFRLGLGDNGLATSRARLALT